jgi:hypothetical protein
MLKTIALIGFGAAIAFAPSPPSLRPTSRLLPRPARRPPPRRGRIEARCGTCQPEQGKGYLGRAHAPHASHAEQIRRDANDAVT